jgi:hypothetical protein
MGALPRGRHADVPRQAGRREALPKQETVTAAGADGGRRLGDIVGGQRQAVKATDPLPSPD